MCGIPITRSVTQEITTSAFFPSTAAAVPSSTAVTALTAAVRTPIRMLRDNPANVRINISLPIQSVPNGYLRHGARLILEKSVSSARSSSRIPAAVTQARNKVAAARKISVLCLLFIFLFTLIFLLPSF